MRLRGFFKFFFYLSDLDLDADPSKNPDTQYCTPKKTRPLLLDPRKTKDSCITSSSDTRVVGCNSMTELDRHDG